MLVGVCHNSSVGDMYTGSSNLLGIGAAKVGEYTLDLGMNTGAWGFNGREVMAML